MARIVFELDIAAPASKVGIALTTAAGVKGWWTEDAKFRGGVGATMKLGFPVAPMPFELRLDEKSADTVRWTSIGEFPPHWSGTTVTWSLTPTDEGTKVHFNHDGWASDEGMFPMSAYTWGQLQGTLKSYVETGKPAPLFTFK